MDGQAKNETIVTSRDVFTMLDEILEKRDSEWWNEFYADRGRGVPFFSDAPDEELVAFCGEKRFRVGKALDIGCGNGRNTRFLAKQGFAATGIDISAESICWANELQCACACAPSFVQKSFFDFAAEPRTFDLILDSGCFHHIKPHRREDYLSKVGTLLKDDGHFLMTCFNLEGGANVSDYDVYRDLSMHGGLGFSEEKIRLVLEHYFEVVDFRKMKESRDAAVFGKGFMWVVLMKKRAATI